MPYNAAMDILSVLAPLGQLDLITIAISAVLFFAARPICKLLNNSEGVDTRASMMRVLNALIPKLSTILYADDLAKKVFLENQPRSLTPILAAA